MLVTAGNRKQALDFIAMAQAIARVPAPDQLHHACDDQAEDGDCKVLVARVGGGNLRYGSGASSVDWAAADADSGRCWAR